jgi:hypothetical protein
MCTIRTCEPRQCTTEAKVCPDGTAVGRTGPNCEFAPCPVNACPAIAKQCPDGSYASPSGPNCDFVCPTASCDAIQKNASDKLQAALDAHAACEVDADCTNVDFAADCSDQCTRAIAKTGESDFKQAVASVNQSVCPEFAKQGCKSFAPPCVAPQTPRCVDKKCQ